MVRAVIWFHDVQYAHSGQLYFTTADQFIALSEDDYVKSYHVLSVKWCGPCCLVSTVLVFTSCLKAH